MKSFADALTRDSHQSQVKKFSQMRHRLIGEDFEENQQLESLRRMADEWFIQPVEARPF